MEDTNEKILTEEIVNAYVTLKVSPSAIKAALTKEGYKKEEIDALVKTRTSDGLTYPEILAFLGKEARTEKELYTLVLTEGTRNEARWVSDRNKIRLTLNAVFDKFDDSVEEELADKTLVEAVKEKGKSKA